MTVPDLQVVRDPVKVGDHCTRAIVIRQRTPRFLQSLPLHQQITNLSIACVRSTLWTFEADLGRETKWRHLRAHLFGFFGARTYTGFTINMHIPMPCVLAFFIPASPVNCQEILVTF